MSVPSGTHIAFPYVDEHERASFLFAYVKAGLENGEQCATAVMEYTRDYWLEGLGTLGIAAEPLLGKQLIILGPMELYQSIKTIPERISRMSMEAAEDGWKGLRICTSMTPLLQQPDKLPLLLQAEVGNCRMLAGSHALLVCTFGRRRLHERVLDECLRIHPTLIVGNELQPNPRYIEHEAYERELSGNLRELEETGALIPPFATLDFTGEIPVLKAIGEMDAFTSPQFEDLGRSICLVGHKSLVVDLSRAPFLDAAAIGTILRLNNAVRSKAGRMAVYDPERPLRRIFQIIHMDQLIAIRHSFEEALEEVRAELRGETSGFAVQAVSPRES